MIRTPRSLHTRSGFSLAEVLVALALTSAAAGVALGAWDRTQEASSLRTAQDQVVAILRDAIRRADQFVPAAMGGVQAQVVFAAGGSTITEQVQEANGPWQALAPAGTSLVLPAGITVASTTWPQNTMEVSAGEIDTGVFQAYHVTTPGSVTLTSAHGMTALVTVTRAGAVQY